MIRLIFKIIKFIIGTIFHFVYSVFTTMIAIFLSIFFIAVFILTVFINDTPAEYKLNYSHLIISDIAYPNEDKEYIPFENASAITFSEVLNRIKYSITDDRIKDIFIDIDKTAFSPAQIEELTPLLKEFKQSGKKIYAYTEDIDKRGYSLALLADEIATPDTSNVDVNLTGYSTTSLYFADLFKDLEYKMEVVHIGSHKSFGEEYYRNQASLESKSDLTRLQDYRLDSFVSSIANNRKLHKEDVEKKILDGKYAYISTKEARDLSLVDTLIDREEFTDKLDIHEHNSINLLNYKYRVKTASSKNTVAIIYLDGEILDDTFATMSNITYKSFKEKLDRALTIPNLEAIVIRINSNGGSAFASQKINKAIKNIEVPVYVSVADIATSGGYYIASAGDNLVINNASVTGSIGVVSVFPKYDKTLKKFGVNVDGVKKGKYTDILNPLVSLTDEDRAIYTKKLEAIYKEFKEDVLEKRVDLDENSLEAIAQGKIWLGVEALENGLADIKGGLFATLDRVDEDLEFNGDYRVVHIYSEANTSTIFNNLSGLFGSRFRIFPFSKLNTEQDKIQFFLQNNGKYLTYYPKLQLEF